MLGLIKACSICKWEHFASFKPSWDINRSYWKGSQANAGNSPKTRFSKRMQSSVLQAVSKKAMENCHGVARLGMGFQKGLWLCWKMVLDLMPTDFASGTRDPWLQPGLAAILESGKHWKSVTCSSFPATSEAVLWDWSGFPHQNGSHSSRFGVSHLSCRPVFKRVGFAALFLAHLYWENGFYFGWTPGVSLSCKLLIPRSVHSIGQGVGNLIFFFKFCVLSA